MYSLSIYSNYNEAHSRILQYPSHTSIWVTLLYKYQLNEFKLVQSNLRDNLLFEINAIWKNFIYFINLVQFEVELLSLFYWDYLYEERIIRNLHSVSSPSKAYMCSSPTMYV